jgi:general secretion pathway protein F
MFGNWLQLGPFILIVAGFLMLWRLRYARQEGRVVSGGRFEARCTVIGWSLLLVGVVSAIAATTNVFMVVALPAAAVVGLIAVRMYRESERKSLLWGLMAAAERGIPLETAARAFARERDDDFADRAQSLADYLEAGVPLPLALKQSRNPLPPAALLAADLGVQTGVLGPALRQVVAEIDEFEGALRSIWEKLAYLVCLVLVGAGILGFLMLYVIPKFAHIFEEYDIALPRATIWLIETCDIFVHWWWVLLPLLAAAVLGLLLGFLHYARYSPHNLPILGHLSRRVDSALIMRWLAVAVQQNRPIGKTVQLLGRYFPQPAVRSKLDRAAARIGQGADWSDSLQREGVIRRFESVVFKSAERAGNLAWALEEMADSSARRSAYRAKAWLSIAFPGAVLAVGVSVFFIAYALLAPLLSLIVDLVGP